MSIVGAYIIFSILLSAFFKIDITIPCLWKSLFAIHCPGCGLTTAAMHLVRLNFIGAYQANPLIFVLVPCGIAYLAKDFFKYNKMHQDIESL